MIIQVCFFFLFLEKYEFILIILCARFFWFFVFNFKNLKQKKSFLFNCSKQIKKVTQIY